MSFRRHYHITDYIIDPVTGVAIDPAGEPQVISLLGPFHVAFDTPDLKFTGAGDTMSLFQYVLAELDPGILVLRAFVIPTIAWTTGEDGDAFRIVVGVNDDRLALMAEYDLFKLDDVPAEPALKTASLELIRGTYQVNEPSLLAALYFSNSPMDTGEADIYALTATSSS